MKKLLCILLICLILIGVVFCVPPSGHRIIKRAVGINTSGCKIEKEVDTHGWMGDGEYLLVLDCSGKEEKILAQTEGWSEFPLTGSLQSLMYDMGKLAEKNDIPVILHGVWYFYDRYNDANDNNFNRLSDERLNSRFSWNFTLVLYDADNSKLYYFEKDT